MLASPFGQGLAIHAALVVDAAAVARTNQVATAVRLGRAIAVLGAAAGDAENLTGIRRLSRGRRETDAEGETESQGDEMNNLLHGVPPLLVPAGRSIGAAGGCLICVEFKIHAQIELAR